MSPLQELEEESGETGDLERWALYRKLILAELKRINDTLESVQKDVHDIQIKMAILSVRAGFYGAAAGLIGGYILQRLLEGKIG